MHNSHNPKQWKFVQDTGNKNSYSEVNEYDGNFWSHWKREVLTVQLRRNSPYAFATSLFNAPSPGWRPKENVRKHIFSVEELLN